MNKISTSLGVLSLMFASASMAATVNVVPSNANPLVGEQFTVTVQAVDFPATVGPSLGLSFDATKVSYVSTALPASGPMAASSGAFLTLFPATGTPTDIFVTPAGSPSGTFDAFVITFNAVAAGAAMIQIIDDQSIRAWFDDVNFEAIPATYNQANVTVGVVPAPATVWLLASGLAGVVVRTVRRKRAAA